MCPRRNVSFWCPSPCKESMWSKSFHICIKQPWVDRQRNKWKSKIKEANQKLTTKLQTIRIQRCDSNKCLPTLVHLIVICSVCPHKSMITVTCSQFGQTRCNKQTHLPANLHWMWSWGAGFHFVSTKDDMQKWKGKHQATSEQVQQLAHFHPLKAC